LPASPRIDEELLKRARTDETVRARLASKGRLFGGYHPEMRAVHEANADWLMERLGEGYWPLADETAPLAVGAFWTIVQHAISRPALMRRVRDLSAPFEDAVTKLRRALLTDRIAVSEGRLQTYGTQIDWDEQGQLSPSPIGDPAGVDARRAAVGLLPLQNELIRQRALAASEGHRRPQNHAAYVAERTLFAVESGWRD
jgi:hypothetical protein